MKFLVCSRLSEHRYKTPEGYLVCVDSILSRTGKQTYSRDELFKDGCNDEVEVERSAEEVFSEKTLASFENKPLTIEHPEEDVTPANHNKYSVGFIRDIKRGKDGSEDVMLGTIVVTDAEAIELIETGKLKELSCGYDCDIEDEDNPQQRNIRGNHVALCEKGRAGIARIVDSVKDATFEVWYVDRHDNKQQTFVIANDQKEARQKVQKIYGPYRIYEVRKVKDGVKDMKVSHDNIREQPVFVMQSDVDKNLFFYIGKTHAMKEGEWTYAQYDMEGMTPDELRKELEANGWHKVARGPAPFIDEDPYEESTEGLEEAEKNLHDEMICNTETDCKDELQTFRIGFGSGGRYDDEPGLDISVDVKATDVKTAIEKAKRWAKAHNYDDAWSFREVKTKGDRHFQIDACKDGYSVAATLSMQIDEAESSDELDDAVYAVETAKKDGDITAAEYRDLRASIYTQRRFLGDSIKDGMKEEWDPYGMTDEEWLQSLDNAYARHKIKEVDITYKKSDLKFFHEDAAKAMSMFKRLAETIRTKSDEYAVSNVDTSGSIWSIKLRLKDSTKDASDNAYRKVQTILSKNPQFKGKINKDEFDTGEIMIDFADYRNADKFVVECRRMGLKCREGYFGPDTTILVRDAATKDAKTEYIFNYRDTYHGTRDKMRVDANNLDEAIREFGKTMALGGFGTANIYVVSVSPNDGYMRAYGKLSEMLKQKWTRDSVKKLDSKKILSIVKAAKSIKK